MWCQPYNKLSVSRSSRCRRAWMLYMQPEILTSGRSGGVLQVSWTCSQPCGARGAVAHASEAMQSDTRAATNLKLIGCCQSVPLMIKRKCCPELVQVYGFRLVKVLLDTPPGSPKNCPLAKGGSVRDQISLYMPVSFYMIKPRVCPSQDQSSPVQSSRPLGFGLVLSDQPAASRLEHCELACVNSTSNLGFPLSLKIVSQQEAELSGSFLARHVALPDHGVGLDGQSCSCLIVGWPVGSFISNPGCWTVDRDENLKVEGVRRQTQTQSERRETDSENWDVVWTGYMVRNKTSLGKDFINIKTRGRSVIIPVMRYEDDCGGLEEDIQGTVVDSVKIYGDEWRMSRR
ncbi:hypothetical protein F2Q68_00031257 [Brassica cretica]|nr:hypothetical protein F2Q68_00031257 [Brassica cretica]